MSQTVVLKVGMSCQGCVGAVKRVLGKMDDEVVTGADEVVTGAGKCLGHYFQPFSGVDSFDIDFEEQKVTVKGNVQPADVLQTVSKTGKKTSFWEEAKAPPPAGAGPEAKPEETVAAA